MGEIIMIKHPLNSPLLAGKWYAVVVNCNGAFVVMNDCEALEEALEDASDVRINGNGSEFYFRNKIGNWIKG